MPALPFVEYLIKIANIMLQVHESLLRQTINQVYYILYCIVNLKIVYNNIKYMCYYK